MICLRNGLLAHFQLGSGRKPYFVSKETTEAAFKKSCPIVFEACSVLVKSSYGA